MIDALREDGRASISQLAAKLGISRANAYARLDALHGAGVIGGFTVRVDPRRTGKHIAAMIFVSVRQDQWADFRSRLPDIAELQYFCVLTGEHDCMLLVRASDVTAVHHLISNVIAHWPSVKATETVFVLDEAWYDYELAPSPTPPGVNSLGSTTFVGAPSTRGVLPSRREG